MNKTLVCGTIVATLLMLWGVGHARAQEGTETGGDEAIEATGEVSADVSAEGAGEADMEGAGEADMEAAPSGEEYVEDTGPVDSAPVADAPVEDDDTGAPGPLVIGAEVGGIFPQIFTQLQTHITFGIEIGYKLPFLDERLEIFLDAGYSPPQRSYTVDPYDVSVEQQELHFSLGPRFRFLEARSDFNVSLAAGFRLFLLRSISNGNRGAEAFAEFQEDSTQAGFFVALGAEYILGPGAIFLDADLGFSDLPHKITGEVSTGNLSLTLGYRLFLL